MVLIGNQITSSFDYSDQMGIANHTPVFLKEEGITTVSDLVKFTSEKIWCQVIYNCKRPPHVTPAGRGALIPQENFRIAAKFLIHLKLVAVAISYYEWTSYPLTDGKI